MGNILSIVVHAANIHDTMSGIEPATQAFVKYPTIKRFCGDEGYRKTFVIEVLDELCLGMDISERIKPQFQIIPKRWVVERTFAWLNNSRRLAKDFEIRKSNAENMVRISHLHTLLKRL